jgi:hypothetical protein
MNNPMSNMTAKQRNFYIFCGVILVGWFVVRFMTNAAQQAAFFRQQAALAAQQRARAEAAARAVKTPAPAPPAVPTKPPVIVLTNLSNLEGTWLGSRILNENGLCTLRLELRPVPEKPDNYMGYSRFNCVPPPGLASLRGGGMLPKRLRENLNPVAIVLTGAPEDGALHFVLDKTVVVPGDGCETSSFTVTPFGTNRIAVEWHEGKCRGAQLLLDKNGR